MSVQLENAAVQKEAHPESWRYSRRGELLPAHCLDCGATMLGAYCSSCGQKNELEHRSLWQLVKDAVGPAVLLESKLWRTLGTLLGRPGELSEAYTEGKRSRYIRPLRLYFWVSVLFFSILTLRPSSVGTFKVDAKDKIHLRFAPGLEKRLQQKLEPLKEPAADGQARPSDERGPNERAAAMERLRNEFISRMPKALFLLLPVFALLLRGLFRTRPYVDQLVFALHAHTVLFIGLAIGLIRWGPVETIGIVGPVVWFLPAVHRFYRVGWVETVLKAVLLAIMYFALVLFVVLATSMVALLGT